MSPVHRSDLILGGVRSGKSREALRLAAAMPRGSRGAFLATAQALDGDMEARIARHRAERPKGWGTLEEPYDVVAACESLTGRVDVVVLDCLTLSHSTSSFIVSTMSRYHFATVIFVVPNTSAISF